MKTMCPPGYHHNGFMATHALGNTINPWLSGFMITGRAYCFHDYIYILRPSCIVCIYIYIYIYKIYNVFLYMENKILFLRDDHVIMKT